MTVSCHCCVLLGRGTCDGPITVAEEPYCVCCVSECDRKDSTIGGTEARLQTEIPRIPGREENFFSFQ
jgi:hypothetical protein